MKRQWLVLLLITALLLGSCFVYADEAATGGITIEIEGQEEGVLPEEDFTAKVSVDQSLDLESLALFAAFYEENGRFLGLKRITVDSESGTGSVAVDNSSELSTMKVFAIKKESAAPVTKAAEAAQPKAEEPPTWYNDGEAFLVTGEEPSEINLKPYLGAYIRAYQNGDGKITKIAEVCSEFLVGNIRNLRENYTMDSVEIFGGFVYFENGDRTAKTFEDVSGAVWLSVELDGMDVKTVYSALVWNPESTFMATDDVQDEIASDKMLDGFKFALDDQGGIDPFSYAIACNTGYYELGDISEDDVVTVFLNKENLISRIEVGKKTVEGTVTNVQTSGSGTVRVTIGGKAYQLNAYSLYSADDFKTLMDNEAEAVFFLDYNDCIFDFYESVGNVSSYGVFLGAVEEDGTEKVSLFRQNGQTAIYPVAAEVSLAIAQGSLVQYTVDPDGKIVEISPATSAAATPMVFSATGAYNGLMVQNDTIVFSFHGTEAGSQAGYAVLSPDILKGKTFSCMDYFSENGALKAVRIEGIDEVTKMGYGVVLKTGTSHDREDNTFTDIQIFTADEHILNYTIEVPGIAEGGAWISAPAAGTLVYYEIDDAAETITDLKLADGSGTDGYFDRNGVYEAYLADANIAAFVFDGDDQQLSDFSNYYTVSASELQESSFDSIDFFNEKGKLTAVLIKGFRK